MFHSLFVGIAVSDVISFFLAKVGLTMLELFYLIYATMLHVCFFSYTFALLKVSFKWQIIILRYSL